MPDLGTHVILGYWLKKHVLPRHFHIPIFLIGCSLPDLIFKTGEIIFCIKYYWFFNTFHTPFSLIFQCLLISLFFRKQIRCSIFINLISGVGFHLLLDSMQYHLLGGNYFWLFPFSNFTTELGLFHVADWPFFLIGSFLLVIFSYFIKKGIRSNA